MISYVSNVNSFPKPLAPDDELSELKKMEKGSDAARTKLIEHNMRLVVHVVKKFVNSGKEMDDLISIGTIGLIKGISSYDYHKGTKLATYVAKCIENEILMVMRASKKTQGEISLEEPLGFDAEGNHITFNDILSQGDEEVIDAAFSQIETKRIHTAMQAVLSQREFSVMAMRYGLAGNVEMTQKEIAGKMNISRSYVSRIEKRAMTKLKAFLRSSEK
jgi:RNA polymerase sporulation-specific sigma factor